MNTGPDDPLEGWTRRLLEAHPPRQAPPALESRVLRAIARRAAQPWWQRGFTQWPWPARVVFVLLACACARLVLALVASAPATGLIPDVPDLALRLGHALAARSGSGWSVSPPGWVQAALACAALLYALLFAITAVAYRTLFQPRHSS